MLAKYRDLSLFDSNYTMWFDNKFRATYEAWYLLRQGGHLFLCLLFTIPIIILDVLHYHFGYKFSSCGQNLYINPTFCMVNCVET